MLSALRYGCSQARTTAEGVDSGPALLGLLGRTVRRRKEDALVVGEQRPVLNQAQPQKGL